VKVQQEQQQRMQRLQLCQLLVLILVRLLLWLKQLHHSSRVLLLLAAHSQLK
jgi:hypothetical protein